MCLPVSQADSVDVQNGLVPSLTQGYSCKRGPLLLPHLNFSPHLDRLNLDQNFLWHLGGSAIKHLPSAQVMILESWD